MRKPSILLILISCLFAACVNIPDKATAVKNFEKEKYLGQWYEIARFDFKFERDLNNTTANYSLNDDGSIKVLNKGYNYKTNKWKDAEGKAKFVNSDKEGRLKVSFFGPFYSGYNIISIGGDYEYALIMGDNLDYIWFLSRYKTMPQEIKDKYVKIATEVGYDTGKLIWVEHDK